MKAIDYAVQRDVKFTDCTIDIFYFYPNGVWDEDKLSLEGALDRYPREEYLWLLCEEA